MDVVKIIDLVQDYKCLWDQRDARYHARDHQRNAWREISEEMKIPVDELKKRWKVLRDTFAKELKKLQQSGQALDTELHSKWPHFKRLLFLQGTIRSYKDNTADSCEVSVENNLDEEASNNTDPLSPHSENKKCTVKRRRDSTEERKFDESFSPNDHDAQFLMSLWPFLKDVPKNRKLMVRNKLQQVLIDEQNDVAPAVKVEYSSD
ncbi:transcription factor Adf-1-like [Cydia fagiglandana]|uniref:transcription factor Adf-1-like n=1 Tax=Cydia fagiglandana TaxID=1458189 RepID=UPI002FEE034B